MKRMDKVNEGMCENEMCSRGVCACMMTIRGKKINGMLVLRCLC